jgi:general secretion pathway protein I
MKKAAESNRGFTLLEVMVALAILATAFAAVLKLHADSMEMMIASRVHTSAAQLAQFKMTEVEIQGLENLRLLSGEFSDLAPDYEWKISVEPTPLMDWSKVTITVSNRYVREGGEYELTEYILSRKREPEPMKLSMRTPPGTGSSFTRERRGS